MMETGPSRDRTRPPERDLIDVPEVHPPSRFLMNAFRLMESALSPIYGILALGTRVPGLPFRGECARLAFDLALSGRSRVSWEEIRAMLFHPMDSTRYFEFDFAAKSLFDLPFRKLLDVSSPRAFPLALFRRKPGLTGDLINPDSYDCRITEGWVDGLRLGSRCRIHNRLIEDAPFPPADYDVVTSLSVIEHIPGDREAVRRMWELLRPGGRLVVTVPCAARGREQYISRDPYGVLPPGEDGTTFFQRFYDEGLLEERFFGLTGKPRRFEVFGERRPGLFRRNAARKRRDALYPWWEEPLMMGRDYARFRSVRELPGEGVVGMEFVKP